MNIIVTIAFILMVVLGLLMLFAPGLLIREDKRDDPQAVSTTKKAGVVFLAFALFAALKFLKYSLT